MEWLTIEVFDSAAAAWAWRDQHAEDLVSMAVSTDAVDWEWHEHRYGVALELCFRTEEARQCFRRLAGVQAALERAPDPTRGVLVYSGRGGGAGAPARLRPRRPAGQGALALPVPVEEPRLACIGTLVLAG